MRPQRESLILALLWLVAGSVAFAEGPLPEGTLSGTVIGPEGKPVAGARVWCYTGNGGQDDPRILEDRTDPDGRFRLGPAEPLYRNPYDLLIDAEGYARQYVPGRDCVIFPGRDNDLGTIRLDRGRVFVGQVLDVDGSPRPGVTVECRVVRSSTGAAGGPIGPAESLTTDAEGRFRTPPLPVGRLALTVHAPERKDGYLFQPIRPGGEEVLEPIRLEPDVPIRGVVSDERGRPIAGLAILTGGPETTTDAEGRFTLRGIGLGQTLQMRAWDGTHIPIDWVVRVADDGLHWTDADGDRIERGPVRELDVRLEPLAWIEGRAIDADTGDPIRVSKAVLCLFDRKPDGEVVLSGCHIPRFEQPEPGRFRIGYTTPTEYHLTVSADGYQDGEAFTPKVSELRTIEGIVVRLKPLSEGDRPDLHHQTISGHVTRDGRPIESGWAALWAPPRQWNVVNAPVLRGRTVEDEAIPYASAPIRDGTYSLNVPFQRDSWYVVIEEAGHPLTQVGPIAVGLDEEKTVDIACTEGGRIRGRVEDAPPEWKGYLWAIAFNRSGIRAEARVDPDGSFRFDPLPPGEYGVKVGHDAYRDSELSRDLKNLTREDFETPAAPWARANVVEVRGGEEAEGVVVRLPEEREGP